MPKKSPQAEGRTSIHPSRRSKTLVMRFHFSLDSEPLQPTFVFALDDEFAAWIRGLENLSSSI